MIVTLMKTLIECQILLYIWSDYDLDDDIIDCLPKCCYIWYDYDLDDDIIVCLPSIAIYGMIMTWMMTALFA